MWTHKKPATGRGRTLSYQFPDMAIKRPHDGFFMLDRLLTIPPDESKGLGRHYSVVFKLYQNIAIFSMEKVHKLYGL